VRYLLFYYMYSRIATWSSYLGNSHLSNRLSLRTFFEKGDNKRPVSRWWIYPKSKSKSQNSCCRVPANTIPGWIPSIVSGGNFHEGKHCDWAPARQLKGVPGSESRTRGRLVSPAKGKKKKIEHSTNMALKSLLIILSLIRSVVKYLQLKIHG